MAQSDQSYSAGMMAVKQTPPEELAAAHWRQTQSLQALAERQDAELAALRAEVARQGEAIRVIDGWLVGRELRAADPATYVPWIGEPHNALLAALAAPVPPAGAPLPGPVADAVARLRWYARNYGNQEGGNSRSALIEADRLEAFWRAQQPALSAEVREAMREAARWLTADSDVEWGTAGAARLAARLRELAGEP